MGCLGSINTIVYALVATSSESVVWTVSTTQRYPVVMLVGQSLEQEENLDRILVGKLLYR